MTGTIANLIDALRQKGTLLDEMCRLLEEEQQCITALDTAKLEANQAEIDLALTKMAKLNSDCGTLLSRSAAELGLEGSALSPVIAGARGREKEILKGLQDELARASSAVQNLLSVNHDLLQDSLGLVNRSLSFFNRMLNHQNTYGDAGRMITSSTGARLVCKEI
jgi:flagellar biosynthesis/type III secretory pathway chaperone